MTDVAAAVPAVPTFSDLVNEAFIAPIRSVLIIDDQYPTWEQIFGAEGYDSDSTKWTGKNKILEVIRQFRKVSPALTVDIHDGTHNEEIGSYLHQSDLLVLDYQLEKEGPHGVRAAAIISDLLDNNHFNLVVVHTAIGDLIDPFNSILLSLVTPLGIPAKKVAEGLEVVEKFEESDKNDLADAAAEIRNSVSASSYLAYHEWCREGGKLFPFISDSEHLQQFRDIAAKAEWNPATRARAFIWGLEPHERRVADHGARPRELSWRHPAAGGHAWIRTNGGFIAFADKKNTDLLNILQSAIEDWKPSPSRLMLSKIRAEISKQGAAAEDFALSDKHAYWQYYQELRKPPLDGSADAARNHRKNLLEAQAARHTERLLDLIGSAAVKYGLKVLECDPTEAKPAAVGFSGHYNVKSEDPDERAKAMKHYNAHISTKPVSGWHLQPGHVFATGQELWVCVSPACDLVPMQKISTAVKESDTASAKPFIAVKLFPRTEIGKAEVNSNTLVFLKERADSSFDIKPYSVYPNPGEFGSPIWRLFVAADFGKIDIKDDRTADIALSYLSGKGKSMGVETCDASIVGQLRYEYALNLIQKLGVEFTRIGLDFSPPDN